jgi:glycosyltransferase involved in cell wall biosynthesis
MGAIEPEPLVSIVMPAFNEEANIGELEQALTDAVEGLPYRFEFLVVEGGSTDRTGELLGDLCARDRRWKHIKLTRNFSVEASITAGYAYARGDAMIVLYSDLQEPPELIPVFLEKWADGYDSVYGVQKGREGEARGRSWLVHRAYRFIETSSEGRIPAGVCDFRLITREVRDALLLCEERVRYLRGLIPWLGFRQTAVPYVRRERTAGESKATMRLLLQYLANGVMGFSLRPLRLIAWTGVAMLAIAAASALVVIGLAIGGAHVPVTLGLGAIGAVFCGLILLALWVVGEYVGRSYVESLRRPLYLVREAVNVDSPPAVASRHQPDLGEGHDEARARGH